MTLTLSDGPLATTAPDTVNYAIDGPAHRILFGSFPRRVRATIGGETIFDTVDGKLLHESNILPVLYVPTVDVRMDLLEPTDHSTHCPFKGDAAYWTIVVGDRRAENAVWGYPEPIAGAEWLGDHVAFYWDALDHWYDEDEEVFGHLRDPYHRVDARPATAEVVVRIDGEELARSSHPLVVSETGLPNRWYLPAGDVRLDRLEPSASSTHCPYKGQASYWSFGDRPDVGWAYQEPMTEAEALRGRIAFAGDDVEIEVTRR